MSYRRPGTGDHLKDCVINWKNFYNILPNLMNAKTPSEFFIWFEKLDLIDRRSMYLCLLKKDIRVPEEYRQYIYGKYRSFNGAGRLLEKWGEA